MSGPRTRRPRWGKDAEKYLLAEDLELIDLRDRVYPDLPLGPPTGRLLPGR